MFSEHKHLWLFSATMEIYIIIMADNDVASDDMKGNIMVLHMRDTRVLFYHEEGTSLCMARNLFNNSINLFRQPKSAFKGDKLVKCKTPMLGQFKICPVWPHPCQCRFPEVYKKFRSCASMYQTCRPGEAQGHDDVITLMRFLHNWPFVMESACHLRIQLTILRPVMLR